MEDKTRLEQNRLEAFIIMDDEFNPVYCGTTGNFKSWSTLVPRSKKGREVYEAMHFSLNDLGVLNINCKIFSRVNDCYVEVYRGGFLRVCDFYRETLQSSMTLHDPDIEKLNSFLDNPDFQRFKALLGKSRR